MMMCACEFTLCSCAHGVFYHLHHSFIKYHIFSMHIVKLIIICTWYLQPSDVHVHMVPEASLSYILFVHMDLSIQFHNIYVHMALSIRIHKTSCAHYTFHGFASSYCVWCFF